MRCSVYVKADWDRYIADTLPETAREAMETHLLECAHCLAVYTSAIESIVEHEENRTMAEESADAIMAYIASAEPLQKWNRRPHPSFLRSTLAHYLIAASITLLLVSSGAFDLFAAGTRAYAAQQEAVSIASEWPQQWLAKAKGWIGGWLQNEEGGHTL